MFPISLAKPVERHSLNLAFKKCAELSGTGLHGWVVRWRGRQYLFEIAAKTGPEELRCSLSFRNVSIAKVRDSDCERLQESH